MDHRIVQPSSESPAALDSRLVERGFTRFPPQTHPVLSRLMEEVRNERHVEARYDRVHKPTQSRSIILL